MRRASGNQPSELDTPAPFPRAVRDELRAWSSREGHVESARRKLMATALAPKAPPRWSLRVPATLVAVGLSAAAGYTVVAHRQGARAVSTPSLRVVSSSAAPVQPPAVPLHLTPETMQTLTFSDGTRLTVSPGADVALAESKGAGRMRLTRGGVEAHTLPPAQGAWSVEAGPFVVSDEAGGRMQVVWDVAASTLSVALGAGQVSVRGSCLGEPRRLFANQHARFSCAAAAPAPVASAAPPPRQAQPAKAAVPSEEPPVAARASALTAASADPGLLAHYTFDQLDDNGLVADQTGQSHDARVDSSGLVKSRDGHGDALAPQAAVGQVASSAPLNALDKSISLAAWVYRNADGLSFEMIVSRQKGEGPGEHFGFGCFQNQLVFLLETDPPEITVKDWGLIPNDRWIHVAATYDGTTAVLYLDGAEVSRRTIERRFYPDETPVLLGANANGPARVVTENWHGKIDDLRIYSRALSADEVSRLAAP